MKRFAGLAFRGVLMLMAGVVLFLALAFIVVPKVMGWVPLTVLTGSMRPHMPPGTEIVVDPITSSAQLDALKVGDVVSYMPKPNDPTLITHRIISISVRADGTRLFTFKGDANPSADPNPVEPQQIKGKLLYFAPWLGYVTHAVPQSGKGLGLVLVAVALLAYAAWEIVSSVFFGRRSGRHGRGRHPGPDDVVDADVARGAVGGADAAGESGAVGAFGAVDPGAADSGAPESGAAECGVDGVVDASAADAVAADAVLADVVAADAGSADVVAADAGSADVVAADGGLADVVAADGGLADVVAADGGSEDRASRELVTASGGLASRELAMVSGGLASRELVVASGRHRR